MILRWSHENELVMLVRVDTILWQRRQPPSSVDAARRCTRSDACPVLKAKVLADLARSRTPRQIAGRLRAEAADEPLEPCTRSPAAGGGVVSHEATYT